MATVTQSIGCNSGLITVVANGGNPPYSYAISTIDGVAQNPTAGDFQTTDTFVITTPGTYTFIVVDANNCNSVSNPVTITISPDVVYTSAVQNVLCNGASSGSITYTISNSNGFQVTFQLVNSNGVVIASNNSGIFTNLPIGTYTVNILQSQGSTSCTFTDTFVITQPSPITGIAVITQNYTCLTNGSIGIQTGSVSGGTAPYLFSIDGVNFSTISDFSGLTSGNYTIYIQDANGCLFTTNSISLLAPNQLTAITFSATALTCPSQVSTVTISTVGGTAPFNYQIIAPVGQTVNNGTNPVFTGLSSGTYTFLVTDSNGCSYQDSYTINALPSIDVIGQTVSNVICFGGNNGEVLFTVNSTNPFNYQVTNTAGTVISSGNNSNLTTISLAGITASTYTISVTDTVTNCTDSATAIINAPSTALAFTFTANQLSCASNGSVTISTIGGWGSYQYQLTQPNGTILGPQSSSTFTNLTQTGTYTISVNDINGCIVSNTFNLATPTNPVAVIASSSDLCFDANGATLVIAVTGGVVPFSYSINGNPSQTSNTFANVTPGSYSILVTDANGCSTTVSQTIQPELTGEIIITKGLDCTSSPNAVIAATVSGGLAPYVFQVSFNGGAFGTSNSIAGNTFIYQTANAGNYQFLITDAQGCSFTSSIITVDPLTQPEIISVSQIQNILCSGGNNGEIEININNSVGAAPFVLDVITTTNSRGNRDDCCSAIHTIRG